MFKISNRLNICVFHTGFNWIFVKRLMSSSAISDVNYGKDSTLSTRSQVIDGRLMSRKILGKVKFEVNKWVGLGNRSPTLSVVLVGNDPASKLYVTNKSKAAYDCGIKSYVVQRPTSISQDELVNIIRDLNADDTVDAILVQLPLPDHINVKPLLDSISKCKDVDGFNSSSIADFALGESGGLIPCTALAVGEILRDIKIKTKGLEAVLVGCSKYIGLPLFFMLSSPFNGFSMTTTVCNIDTPQSSLEHFLQRSDVIVSVVGKPGIIKGDLIKPGAVVIDVGISVIKEEDEQKVVGDVEFEKAKERASYITPVPGGVGPLTVAMLMQNTLQCAVLCKQRKLSLEQATSMTED